MARDRSKDIEFLDMPWPIAILAALSALLVVCLCTARVFYKPFRQASASMEPAIPRGSYFLVDKFAYAGERKPQHGDIIVFRPDTQPDIDFVKRVVAVSGDRVQLRSGILYVNDRPVTSTTITPGTLFHDSRPAGPVDIAEERTAAGQPYRVLSFDTLPGDDTQQYEVPRNSVFVLGDNRDNSSDSRYEMGGFGYVSEAKVLGKAMFIWGAPQNVVQCVTSADNRWCVEN